MRRHVPKIKKGNLRSNVGKMFSSSKKLPKAQPGKEIVDASKLQAFNPMFYGDGSGGTNYVAQVFGTGADMFHYDQGIGGLKTKSGSGYGQQFPGAPDPAMYGGNQRKYIRALNRFGRQTAKDYRDLYTGGVNPSRISTSRLGAIPGAQQYQDAYDKLYNFIDSEIEMINQANQNVGNSGKNKRTKGKGNKNRLFR